VRAIKHRHLLLLLAAPLAALLGGCFPTVHFSERPRQECVEPPPPPCKPEHFDELTIDTSSSSMGRSPYYLAIARVRGLNTEANEYSVAFPSAAARALATIRENDRDQIFPARFLHVDEAVVERELPAEGLSGSVGGAAPRSADSIQFAAKLASSVLGDYDLFAGRYAYDGIDAASRSRLSSVIYWDAQPALSPDGNSLYFASDRPGGSGGTDIYRSTRDAGGNWSAPENIGPAVNSPCDELSPWVSGDGAWLYFSSAGHQTVGGYDLFRAPILGGQLGEAENLGKPINTPDDELFPSAPPNASPDTLLYYSSNQPGSNHFDIYVLHRMKRKGVALTNVNPRSVQLKGTVRTSVGEPVDSALVTLESHDPPGEVDSTVTDPKGEYRFNVEEGKRYTLVAGSDSTLFVHEEVRVPIDGRLNVTHDVVLSDTVTFRVNFPFNNASDPYEFTLDDRGLPSDLRWTTMMDHAAEFLKHYNGSTAHHFEIVGHTDPVGSDPFNLDLGRRRAEFIRQELVRRGVNSELLGVYSLGESKPLDERPDETEELYHARLRRVELIRK
jgi:hypothetical protein